jgi:hypothetical protein
MTLSLFLTVGLILAALAVGEIICSLLFDEDIPKSD